MINKFNALEIFNSDEYIIPLYQRAYAWGDEQLNQLIEDINDVEGEKYYLGTLIVSKKNDKYEVIDGQQRLTSLFLLLNYLNEEIDVNLSFACREKSNYTLSKINDCISERWDELDADKIEMTIFSGIKTISKVFNQHKIDIDDFKNKLKKVTIYRIEVPKHTDLNRYFEIMNTRGEQLEQHDILKARLMEKLNSREKDAFAKIWDACSDMTGYVQMHFNPNDRGKIFGDSWSNIPSKNWEDLKQIAENSQNPDDQSRDSSILEIIEDYIGEVNKENIDTDNDGRVRFESIITFPYFLLHTLRVYVAQNENDEEMVNKLLDDTKLLKSLKEVMEKMDSKEGQIRTNASDFARGFIVCLLRTRFLFDKYIIKRDFDKDQVEGEWSLKSLSATGGESNRTVYYSNTIGECEKTYKNRNKTNLMIQSALRVSYTSPKVMHWITALLKWLSSEEAKSEVNDIEIFNLSEVAENIACDAVYGFIKDGNYSMGISTPHIVFNYLDYLLWKIDDEKDDNDKEYSDFNFEFRNSVEHWYPRNPSDDSFEKWREDEGNYIDRFGNLCLIQRNINSKFSNLSPEAKKSTYINMINKGSIKLRKMSELTKEYEGKNGSRYWKETACKKHEEEMIKILKNECDKRTKR